MLQVDFEKVDAQFNEALQAKGVAAEKLRSLDNASQAAAIAQEIEQAVRRRAGELGLEVVSVGIRDVILPGEMKEILNRVVEAEKAAQARSLALEQASEAHKVALHQAEERREELVRRALTSFSLHPPDETPAEESVPVDPLEAEQARADPDRERRCPEDQGAAGE